MFCSIRQMSCTVDCRVYILVAKGMHSVIAAFCMTMLIFFLCILIYIDLLSVLYLDISLSYSVLMLETVYLVIRFFKYFWFLLTMLQWRVWSWENREHQEGYLLLCFSCVRIRWIERRREEGMRHNMPLHNCACYQL